MQYEYAKEAAEFVQARLEQPVRLGIILGSGLGNIANEIVNKREIPYEEIPHFKASTAPGHKGQLVAGVLNGTPVICMQGRLHYYEGHSMQDIAFPIRVMKLLDVETLIVTNAAGGINLSYQVGDLMVIEDHVNFQGNHPLIGPNEDRFGPRFCDMTYAYAPELRLLADKAAQELGISLRHGVYFSYSGPSFETPAEIRAFRTLGADAVGMSTVPEVIVANHCGMKVLAISLITNMAAGVLDRRLDEQEVIEIGNRQGIVLQALIQKIIPLI